MADKICMELAQGKSLRTVLKMDGMPPGTTVWAWLRTREDFQKQYARAKQEAADAMAEDILDIADDSQDDWETRINSRTGEEYEVLNKEAVQRSRLRVDTRRWLLSKMQPKKYGDKIEFDGLPQNPIKFVNEVLPEQPNQGDLLPDDKSDSEPTTS